MAREPLARKNFRLRQSKIDETRKILGAATETEAIEKALDEVIFRERLLAGVDAMRGADLVDILVVAQEVLAGATSSDLRRRTERSFLRPFETVGRVITPTHRAWKRAGEIAAALIRDGQLTAGGIGRGFMSDCVLAASAREHGYMLVTRNLRDFGRIAAVEPLEFAAPWPAPR